MDSQSFKSRISFFQHALDKKVILIIVRLLILVIIEIRLGYINYERIHHLPKEICNI